MVIDQMQHNRNCIAVSEIIGTVLLLFIAISAMAVIYYNVLADDGPNPKTIVRIVGHGEGEYIYLEHNGGENIDLDNEITYTIAGDSFPSRTIGDLIYKNKEPLDKWNLGEELKIPINYNLDKLDEFQIAEITGIDTESNSMIFNGPVTLPQPVSDLGIDISVENLDDDPIDGGDRLQITITLTSYGGNVEGSGGVIVNYMIPDGLTYLSSDSPSGHEKEPYDPQTGDWNAGNILVGNPAILEIDVEVNESLGRIPTQLSLILDGSGSIMDYDWIKGTDYAHDGTNAAKSSAATHSSYFLHEGKFGCNSLNTSDASEIQIEFWYRLYDSYGTVENGDVLIECYDGNEWDEVDSIFGSPAETWYPHSLTITDSQYFIPNFKIRFNSSNLFEGWGSDYQYHDEMIWIDEVVIQKDGISILEDSFEDDPWDTNWKSDWDMTLIGLSNAIKNESVFPYDGSVELSVVQFGDEISRREIDPVNVSSSDIANNTADDILAINQRKYGTPMAAGIYLATDQILTSDEYDPDKRQAVVLVTDGLPNWCSERPFTNYPNGPYDSYSSSCDAEESTEIAREDLLSTFNMDNESDTIDELNALAIGAAPDITWLNGSIIWPNPYIWDIQNNGFLNPGWVAHIDSFEQFEFAMNEMFKALFSLHNTVNLVGSTTYDPNNTNNQATVTIG